MDVKITVCLIAIVAAVRYGLNAALAAMVFGRT
jgi:hypothetical protein